ncbi:PaaI family thioesterase [Patulibacter sp. NPDC049589]|uniref:PaaI family thioesterase n=1 Tax=Patulibacter sp. NPDC049589 TaxID=3154731 RepID=UPI00341E905C
MAALTQHNPHCLGCGADNASSIGFELVEVGPGRLRATVAFTHFHEGAQGRVHGGAVATALDEALGQLAQLECVGGCATGELTVRYHRETASGAAYEVESRLDRREGRKLFMTGELRRGDVVLASANATMFAARAEGPEG